MTHYIAFLRGINVGAHNRMTMEELRAVFKSIGYEDVETYIQSGNVLSGTDETNEAALRDTIQDAIADEFGYDITVMTRTRAELEDVVAGQPFDVPGGGGINHYVTFLNEAPADEQSEAILAAQNESELFEIRGRQVYSELNKDKLGSGRFTDVGKLLDMPATCRNWTVVTAIHELSK